MYVSLLNILDTEGSLKRALNVGKWCLHQFDNLWAKVRQELKKYVYKYNNYRPHNSLDFKTPMEYYEDIIKKEGIFSQMYVG